MLKLLIHFFLGLLISFFPVQAEKKLTHQEKQFFESKIRPIFAEHCYKCHSKDSEKLKGNLLLDSQAGWQTGGTHGAVITPFKPEDSRLMEAVQYNNKHLQMPPKEKLPQKKIDLLIQWIKMGAPDPRTGDIDFVKNRSRIDILKSQKNYWAFKPLKQPQTPTVKNTSWSERPLDKFILEKLEKAGISPNSKLSKQKLIRRLYFDIIGLPPTPEKIDEFLNNKSPKATEELIDELLNNQHYGERWARHWMDVARFAESFGFEQDYNRPYAYFYRDFLIKAFNDDMPYNQFVQWQIAGDEIAPQEPMANMATGFLAAGVFPTQLTEAEFETARYDELDDVIGTVGTTFLGLTVSCARCHNHKYDPIPQSDYYRMAATFATSIRAIDHIKFPKDSPFLENAKKLAQKSVTDFKNYGEKQLEKAFLGYQKKNLKKVDKLKLSDPLKELFKKTYSTLNASEKQELITWYKTVDRKYKSLKEELELTEKNSQQSKARVMVMTEGLKNIPHHADGRGYPHFYKDVYHLKRGSPSNKEEIAKPGFLQVATHSSKTEKDWMTTPPKDWRTSYRRRAMAEWMIDEKHGAGQLVARVMVNRLWQHHFGQGIVKTPNDFGRQGEKPLHPELLDYLASKLIQNNWSLKSIHRLILNSETYQVDSQHHDQKQSVVLETTFKTLRSRNYKR